MIAFVQRLLGCALIGEQLEHVLPIFYGTGANGKSTLVNTVLAALGDYAIVLGEDYLLHSKQQRHSTEIMDLYDTRLAVSAETDAGARLYESRVKNQTGGGKLRARKMHHDSIEFEQTHTLLLETNHKPRITGTDNGIWRRVLLIPFTEKIPVNKQDPELPSRLREELPSIMKWLVEGCVSYQELGLRPPGSVRAATALYQEESDLFGAFLDECCEIGHDKMTGITELYTAYQQHALGRGERPLAAKRIAERLEQMGIVKKKTSKKRCYSGVTLKDSTKR